MPTQLKKEIEELHEGAIKSLWNEIYNAIDTIGITRTFEELTISFPLNRIYEIDGYWKKYKYETIDFGFYKIKLNNAMEYSYKDMQIGMDFYSDGNTGFLEISRTA